MAEVLQEPGSFIVAGSWSRPQVYRVEKVTAKTVIGIDVEYAGRRNTLYKADLFAWASTEQFARRLKERIVSSDALRVQEQRASEDRHVARVKAICAGDPS